MPHIRAIRWSRCLPWLAAALIVKVTFSVLLEYTRYFPPDFGSDFLRGRESHFAGAYQWAFYTHIIAGPVSLLLGLLLVGSWLRRRWPVWHRRLGRALGLVVLVGVVPSGLWMARYAAAGIWAGVGLAVLAVLTATCVLLGWRAAVLRRFDDHRRWMERTYTLLASAVVLRIFGGLGTVAAIDWPWYDPLANWLCWMLPLLGLEIVERLRASQGRSTVLRPRSSLLSQHSRHAP